MSDYITPEEGVGMTNVNKAAEVIADHNADGVCSGPECLAQDLADAGLLMPDLTEHPATLVTVRDYENAPEGTLVAESGLYGRAFGKHNDDWMMFTAPVVKDEYDMAGIRRTVLRWGWRE